MLLSVNVPLTMPPGEIMVCSFYINYDLENHERMCSAKGKNELDLTTKDFLLFKLSKVKRTIKTL